MSVCKLYYYTIYYYLYTATGDLFLLVMIYVSHMYYLVMNVYMEIRNEKIKLQKKVFNSV